MSKAQEYHIHIDPVDPELIRQQIIDTARQVQRYGSPRPRTHLRDTPPEPRPVRRRWWRAVRRAWSGIQTGWRWLFWTEAQP